MSKFIKNSRIINRPKSFTTVTSSEYTWSSMGESKQYKEENKQMEEYRQKMKLEKQRIESIPFEQLSFKDIYIEPFEKTSGMNWVYSGNSFVFQFLSGGKGDKNKVIEILNGKKTEYKRQNLSYINGEILIDDKPFILIRGWGNLTGIGAYNLDAEYASKIQDTLAEYIVEKLRK